MAQPKAETDDQISKLTSLVAQLVEQNTRREQMLEQQLQQARATDSNRQNQNISESQNKTVKLPANSTPILHADCSLRDFDTWKYKIMGYVALSNLDKLPAKEQQAVLHASVDEDWSRILRFSLSISQTSDMQQCITQMEEHLRAQRNIIIDRRDFYLRSQQPGESFDTFLCAIKEIQSFCDFCTVCSDDRLRDKIMMGTSDEQALSHMLREKDMNLLRAIDICRSSEAAKTNSSQIKGESCRAVSRNHTYKADTRPSERQSCTRCGSKCSGGQKCPAYGQTCRACGKNGHYAKACRSNNRRASQKTNRRQRSVQAEANEQVRRIRVGDVRRKQKGKPAPTISINVKPSQGRSADIRWIADTGAECSVINSAVAAKLGIKTTSLSNCSARLCSADGGRLHCSGTCEATLQLGDATCSTTLYVVPTATDALLSWSDAVDLRIIHRAFPQQLPECRSSKQAASTNSTCVSAGKMQSVSASKSGECPAYAAAVSRSTSEGCPAGAPPNEGNQRRRASDAVSGDRDVSERSRPTWTHTREPTTMERRQHADEIRRAFPDVFSEDGPLRCMKGPPMRISLTENARATSVYAPRNIPVGYREHIKRHLDELVEQDVIEHITRPTEWCHPVVPVPKRGSDGKIIGCRLTIDLTKLNRYVLRPAYPVRVPLHAVSNITPGCRYLSTLDAKHGYFQIGIHENDRDLTCFMTPWGRYRLKRAPMGLISSGDVYNQRCEMALAGLVNMTKIVDDILVYDTTYDEHLKHVWNVLQRCREHGITLNKQKFTFAEPRVHYCGFMVDSDGYRVDDKKLEAISKFPRPSNVSEVRSFLGLANQLSQFSTEIASTTAPLRHLLRKDVEWRWDEAIHTPAFEATKRALTSPPVLDFYEPSRQTVVETDAARLHGLGFVVRQMDEQQRWRLVQCGSRALTETETRYAAVEQEMLAVVWACHKANNYLAGAKKFVIMTDHKPLLPILNTKSIAEINNPRLQRMRSKLSHLRFEAVWKAGKEHVIADCLSRSPLPIASDENIDSADGDGTGGNSEHSVTISRLLDEQAESQTNSGDILLDRIIEAGKSDHEYLTLFNTVKHGFPAEKYQLDELMCPYWNVRNDLRLDGDVILYGHRLVVPRALRREVLNSLHASHQGIVRTTQRARQAVYWPTLNNEIKLMVSSCQQCVTHRRSLQKEEYLCDDTPTRVFESVSSDYFTYAGRTYLVYVDRLSNWPVVVDCPRGDSTSRHLVKTMRKLFAMFGAPNRLRSDGGPQYTSRRTAEFFKRWHVEHRISSPEYPQGNGHAEATVKKIKLLVQKTTLNGDLDNDAFTEGLMEMRNTPGRDGRSPAQVLFGHPIRSQVPTHHTAFSQEWQQRADVCDTVREVEQKKAQEAYNKTSKPLPRLKVGQDVYIQDQSTKQWQRKGTVVGVRDHRNYALRMPSGRIAIRNRRYLLVETRPTVVNPERSDITRQRDNSDNASTTVGHADPQNCQQAERPRRSQRNRRRPGYLKDYVCPIKRQTEGEVYGARLASLAVVTQ